MYQLTGLIIAGIMAGLAVGAGLNPVPADHSYDQNFPSDFSMQLPAFV